MPWAKIDDAFHRHPKARAAGLRGRALYVAGLCWANYQRSDGHIADHDLTIVAAEADVSPNTARKLVDVGLWDRTDGGYQIHDFLEHNFSAEQMEERRAKRASAGRIGGQRSGQARRTKKEPPAQPPAEANAEANASAHGQAAGEAPTNPMAHDPCTPSSKPTSEEREPPPTGPAAATPEAVIHQALALLVDRTIAARPPHTNPDGYRRSLEAGKRADHLDDAHSWLERDPHLTAEQLADLLEPSPRPSAADTSAPSPAETTVQALMGDIERNAARAAGKTCRTCDGALWLDPELDDQGRWGPVQPCPDCNEEARTA